jgi:hypothetical protein
MLGQLVTNRYRAERGSLGPTKIDVGIQPSEIIMMGSVPSLIVLTIVAFNSLVHADLFGQEPDSDTGIRVISGLNKESNGYGDCWALIIGINYEGANKGVPAVAKSLVPILKNARSDAEAMKTALVELYGYQEDHVLLRTDGNSKTNEQRATKAVIEEALIDELRKLAEKQKQNFQLIPKVDNDDNNDIAKLHELRLRHYSELLSVGNNKSKEEVVKGTYLR